MSTRAAIRYAKAVLDLAKTKNTADTVYSDMQGIANTIAGSSDLKDMLNSSIIKSPVKKETFLKVFPNLNETTKGLLDVLITNKRINLIGHIATSYQTLFDASKGIVEATVTTALPLTDALKDKVLAKVKDLTKSDNVAIKNITDETIIGGFILRVGDKEYNASIANQLNKLKREFTLN